MGEWRWSHTAFRGKAASTRGGDVPDQTLPEPSPHRWELQSSFNAGFKVPGKLEARSEHSSGGTATNRPGSALL